MKRESTIFAGWFAVLTCFFLFANLAGLVRPRGLLPFRDIGFPFTIAAWGSGIHEFFSWETLGLNALIAGMVSGLLAYACAAWRRR